MVRAINLRYWVAKEYLQELVNLSKSHSELVVIVMDDVHLLDAVAALKARLKTPIKLIFSFHGFRLNLPLKLQKHVDKVLFLTSLCYQESKFASGVFLPKVAIVGNAVDSKKFYPANSAERQKQRESLNISETSTVFIWMANDRPIKGLAMFQQIAAHYKKEGLDYTFLVIGNAKSYDDQNCIYLGKIQNEQLAFYLQVGNYYLFTALTEEGFGLSVIEAYKCGNFVIAPNKGALPEVLNNLQNSTFLQDPTSLEQWLATIDRVLLKDSNPLTKQAAISIWSYEAWEQKFIKAITSDL